MSSGVTESGLFQFVSVTIRVPLFFEHGNDTEEEHLPSEMLGMQAGKRHRLFIVVSSVCFSDNPCSIVFLNTPACHERIYERAGKKNACLPKCLACRQGNDTDVELG